AAGAYLLMSRPRPTPAGEAVTKADAPKDSPATSDSPKPPPDEDRTPKKKTEEKPSTKTSPEEGAETKALALINKARQSAAAAAARDDGGWVTVLDRRGAAKPDLGAVLYPAPDQPHVPLAFTGNEVPDPLPQTTEKLTGHPITVTFPAGAAITGAAARLEDE